VPAPKVQRIEVENFFLRFAPCARASGSQEKREQKKKIFALRALCQRLRFKE
jgi:hypothetical protein